MLTGWPPAMLIVAAMEWGDGLAAELADGCEDLVRVDVAFERMLRGRVVGLVDHDIVEGRAVELLVAPTACSSTWKLRAPA